MARKTAFSLNAQVRKLSKIGLACALSLTALVSNGCTSGTSSDTTAKKMELTPAMKTALGPDDGYAFALMYGADLGGSLDDCGCHAHPMGGLAWRMSYVDAFSSMHSDVPALQVDAGHVFADTMDGNSMLFPDSVERNKWILKGYDKAHFTVANISFREAPYISELLRKNDYPSRVKEFPFLERMVSANVRTSAPDLMAPKTYLVEEVNAKRAGKTVRVAFTGVTSGGTIPTSTGLTLADPVESLKQLVPEMRTKADIVVVMAYSLPPDAEKVAAIPGVDIVIGAQNGQGGMETKKIGNTTLVYTFQQTKQLGDLRVYLTPDGKVKEFKNHFAALDKEFPKHETYAQMVKDAKDSVEAAQRAQSGTQGVIPAGPTSNNPAGVPKLPGTN